MSASNLDEHFLCLRASPAKMDLYWAEGWRHFGVIFVRYRMSSHGGKPYTVLPLRVDLARFQLTRSQKRVLAKNRDIEVIVRPSFINNEKQILFDRHCVRFDDNVPDSLFNFLSPNPAEIPCPNLELCIYLHGRLVGVRPHGTAPPRPSTAPSRRGSRRPCRPRRAPRSARRRRTTRSRSTSSRR